MKQGGKERKWKKCINSIRNVNLGALNEKLKTKPNNADTDQSTQTR